MNKLDILGIDGITYLTDERYKRGDNKTTGLTNISEDLMSLSLELGVPIIVAAQSNRSGVKKDEEEGTPDLDTIRDSDGIAFNATKVIAIRQTGAGLEFGIKKHRDGPVGDKLIYYWDIDKGIFTYIPSSLDGASSEHRDRKIDDLKKSFGNGVDVF
jgi:replicative DNA helicase